MSGIREQIARRHGLPASFAERLKGDTPEELERDAAVLAVLGGRSREPQTIADLTAQDWRKFEERKASDNDRVKRRLGLNDER